MWKGPGTEWGGQPIRNARRDLPVSYGSEHNWEQNWGWTRASVVGRGLSHSQGGTNPCTPTLLQACPDPSLKAKLHALTLAATTVLAFKFSGMIGSSKQCSSEGRFEEAGEGQSHIRKRVWEFCGVSMRVAFGSHLQFWVPMLGDYAKSSSNKPVREKSNALRTIPRGTWKQISQKEGSLKDG